MSSHSGRDASDEIKCIRVDSAFGFGGLYRLADILFRHGEAPRGVVLDMSEIALLDSTGVRALEYFQSRCRREDVGFLLKEVRSQPLAALKRTALMSSVAKVFRGRRG